MSKQGLTDSSGEIFVPSFDPATGKFTWMVNYDETIAEKIAAAIADPLFLDDSSYCVRDRNFPDERKGNRIVVGRIWHPDFEIEPRFIGKESGGVPSRPKELIDFNKSFPLPELNVDMQLVAPGQAWVDERDVRRCYYPHLNFNGEGLHREKRELSYHYLSRGLELFVFSSGLPKRWSKGTSFLILDR